MAAFGTTTTALETYAYMNERCKERFPEHDVIWCYCSRMVKDWIKKRHNVDMRHPYQVLDELAEKGHPWAVVQSLHLLCGHEFYRLVQEVGGCRIRTSVGLPLLSHPGDYEAVVQGLKKELPDMKRQAVVFVGHGTDHPIWCAHLALERVLRERLGPHVYVGMIDSPSSCEETVEKVAGIDIKKVHLIPFMLVAGNHFMLDLAGEENGSWKNAFEERGITVTLWNKGLGFIPDIVDIFCQHIEDAMDVIPGSTSCQIQSGDIYMATTGYDDREIISPYLMASAEEV
jgi:sirohydrochlorin cobaltochelatase